MTDTKPPTIFGQEMRAHGSTWLLNLPSGWLVRVGHGVWMVRHGGKLNTWINSTERRPTHLLEASAQDAEGFLRSLVLSLAPLLDPDAKREVVKALGFHVCDACSDMRAGTWEEARDAGWVHGTFGPGPDGADAV